MSISKLNQAIKKHPSGPTGIEVGKRFHDDLRSTGRIKRIQIDTLDGYGI